MAKHRMRPLTAKQEQVLAFIREKLTTQGHSPTVREIAAHMGVLSSCSAQRVTEALERKGFITRERYKYRSLAVTGMVAPIDRTQTLERLLRAAIQEMHPFDHTQTCTTTDIWEIGPCDCWLGEARALLGETT